MGVRRGLLDSRPCSVCQEKLTRGNLVETSGHELWVVDMGRDSGQAPGGPRQQGG